MSSSFEGPGKNRRVVAWTQEEIDAVEDRGGVWANHKPIAGIDYGTFPPHMWPLNTSRDWNNYTPPEDDDDDDD